MNASRARLESLVDGEWHLVCYPFLMKVIGPGIVIVEAMTGYYYPPPVAKFRLAEREFDAAWRPATGHPAHALMVLYRVEWLRIWGLEQ